FELLFKLRIVFGRHAEIIRRHVMNNCFFIWPGSSMEPCLGYDWWNMQRVGFDVSILVKQTPRIAERFGIALLDITEPAKLAFYPIKISMAVTVSTDQAG